MIMNRKYYLHLFLTLLLFLNIDKAKAQIDLGLDWNDPRLFDSVMNINIYDINNNNVPQILDFAIDMSNFLEFSNDNTLNIFYSIYIRTIDNNKIKILLYPNQTSEMTFTICSLGAGKLPNGILIYKNTEFLINYWLNDSIAVEFINNNFNITNK
ncbi:MAG: hypothetical protein H6Q15_821 [Bacteroidetes bacterium]|nr:hypothetical protein [Bacteroidota bacterium]